MRLAATAAAIVLPTVLAACSGATTDGAQPVSDGARKGRLTKIVYINPLPNNAFWDYIGDCMQREAARRGARVEEKGPPGGNVNVQLMQNMLSQAVATRAQAVVTWSLGAGESFDQLFAKLREKGSVVATVLSPGATKNQNFGIGTSWAEHARLQIQAIARRRGPQRVGVIWQQPTGPVYGDYLSALKDEVAKHPNISIEDIKFNYGKFTDDISITSTMLTTHPQINVMLNYSGFPGMLTAIKEKGRVGKVVAFMSADSRAVTAGYVEQGLIGGVAVVDACRVGTLVTSKLFDAWAGKPVEPHYDDGWMIVSGERFLALPARFM